MKFAVRKFHGSSLLHSLPKIQLKSSAIELNLPEKSIFHFQWLRDNCQCPSCIHPPTKQKLHSSGQIKPMKPLKVEYITEKQIEIIWPGNMIGNQKDVGQHKSVYDIEWLKRFNYNVEFKPLVSPIEWTAEEYIKMRETIEFQEFMGPVGFKKALSQIRDYGICFLKNVPTKEITQVETVANRFGEIRV